MDLPTIGDKLNGVRNGFGSTCDRLGLPRSSHALRQLDSEDLQNVSLDLVSALRNIPDLRRRPSLNNRKSLSSDILRLNSAISSDDFDSDRLISLLSAIVNEESDDIIWSNLHAVLVESTPTPRSRPFLGQISYLHTTSSFVNSSEQRKHVDAVLKEELESIYIGVQGFYEAYFGDIDTLEEAGATVFRKCQEGDNPLFTVDGWRDWPEGAKERDVLDWLSAWVNQIRGVASEEGFAINSQRTVLAQPDRPLEGSIANRKLDIDIVRNSDASRNHHWSDILVLGELKCNPKEDSSSKTWRDLGRYAREVLTTQDTRRFALAFTLCGSTMRLWEFDRVGAIASSPFDINKDGLRFVSTILGFLQMNDNQLGYDPSIKSTSDGRQFIEIIRDGQSECISLDSLMKRSPCVAGRATTCWKAHREGDEADASAPLVVKDSWQYPEREEEGKLLQEATETGVVNVARYYYHETVQVNGKVDDIRDNVRRGLDVAQSTSHRLIRGSSAASDTADAARIGRSTSSVGHKRSSSRVGVALPPSKRTCSSSPSKGGYTSTLQNRVHRRVIIRDYGTPIHKARSRVSMLSALENCIKGYESLQTKAGFLQGDISTGNLILNEEDGNPSWPAFLIDLDLAINEQRERPSGARGKTGTRAFMAIGLLLGEKHFFMHDLESFFWVLFWVCIHYAGPGEQHRVVPRFDKWNYAETKELAEIKKGLVVDEADFIALATENFAEYYMPLIRWVNKLRKVVFPSGGRWKKENKELYRQMMDILQEARSDESVVAGT
ncbi:hypothetical protein ABOM_000792 [Aspergillus bombycis]|uniref:Fungal-type protein kinase domain-containing protein n=1 Tax=Aspergillus bombycis TaxID=109264 RepID=A0A1F8AGJ3_9EURO|nr:hypothetical protein ABOM_000792 [Aspergillus bombycis]OGM50853.1 hypothetical protein ABOM_000792 [Aspergillus bombycis]